MKAQCLEGLGTRGLGKNDEFRCVHSAEDVPGRCPTSAGHRGLGGGCVCGEDGKQSRATHAPLPGCCLRSARAQPPAVCSGGALAAASDCGLCPRQQKPRGLSGRAVEIVPSPPYQYHPQLAKRFFATPLGHLNRKGPHSAMHAHVQGIMVYGAPTRCLMVPPWEQ